MQTSGIFNDLVSNLKSMSSIISSLRAIDLNIDRAELQSRMTEIMLKLSEANLNLSSIQQIIIERDQEIRMLKEKSEIKDDLIYQAPFYTSKSNKGEFCQQCFDNHSKKIRLQSSGNGYWHCATCKNNFVDSTHEPANFLGGYDSADDI